MLEGTEDMTDQAGVDTAESADQATDGASIQTSMMRYLSRFRGGGTIPARPPMKAILITWLGGFVAIATVALVGLSTETVLVLGSFGATCVLVFGFPESPFSQPRNVLGGHFLSTATGLAFFHFIGPHWWSMALALATAIALMQITRTVHPPAGSNPLIVFLAGASWQFLFAPTLFGAMILVLVALIYNNISTDRRYPQYWF